VYAGRRDTLALSWVRRRETGAVVLRRLLARLRQQGLRIKLLLLDRYFFGVPVTALLQESRVPFLMPVAERGRKPRCKAALVDPCLHHELELLLDARVDEDAQQAPLFPIRPRRVVNRAVGQPPADAAVIMAAASLHGFSPRVGAPDVRSRRRPHPLAVIEALRAPGRWDVVEVVLAQGRYRRVGRVCIRRQGRRNAVTQAAAHLGRQQLGSMTSRCRARKRSISATSWRSTRNTPKLPLSPSARGVGTGTCLARLFSNCTVFAMVTVAEKTAFIDPFWEPSSAERDLFPHQEPKYPG
jgi:hypothetical protein